MSIVKKGIVLTNIFVKQAPLAFLASPARTVIPAQLEPQAITVDLVQLDLKANPAHLAITAAQAQLDQLAPSAPSALLADLGHLAITVDRAQLAQLVQLALPGQ